MFAGCYSWEWARSQRDHEEREIAAAPPSAMLIIKATAGWTTRVAWEANELHQAEDTYDAWVYTREKIERRIVGRCEGYIFILMICYVRRLHLHARLTADTIKFGKGHIRDWIEYAETFYLVGYNSSHLRVPTIIRKTSTMYFAHVFLPIVRVILVKTIIWYLPKALETHHLFAHAQIWLPEIAHNSRSSVMTRLPKLIHTRYRITRFSPKISNINTCETGIIHYKKEKYRGVSEFWRTVAFLLNESYLRRARLAPHVSLQNWHRKLRCYLIDEWK